MRWQSSAGTILLLSLGCAHSGGNGALRDVRAGYDRLERAFAARDTTAILEMRTPDFSSVFPDGRRNGPEQNAEALRQFFVLNQPPMTSRNTIRSVERQVPDTLVLNVFQEASRYQDLAGARRQVRHDVTQTETWVQTPSGWRLNSVCCIRDRHRWVDGKPIDPSKPFDPAAPPFTGH